MNIYVRPELTDPQKREIMNALNHIQRLGFAKTLVYLLNAFYENARLTAEVNQHRQTLGYEPLPSYKPIVGLKQ